MQEFQPILCYGEVCTVEYLKDAFDLSFDDQGYPDVFDKPFTFDERFVLNVTGVLQIGNPDHGLLRYNLTGKSLSQTDLRARGRRCLETGAGNVRKALDVGVI